MSNGNISLTVFLGQLGGFDLDVYAELTFKDAAAFGEFHEYII